MKVLLTHGYFLKEDPSELEIMKPYPPLGMLYISAWLEQKGIEHDLFDTTFSDFGELENHIRSFRPDIIGIYTTLMTKLNVLKLISFIRKDQKDSACFIIIGGPDGRHNARNYLEYGADVIIPGEGEIAFEETVVRIKSKPGQSGIKNDNWFSSFREIPGIIFKNNPGEVISTADRKSLAMEELPFPARHRADIAKYMKAWKDHHGYSSLTINTMRGCPYGCNWCSKNIYGNTYRRRDPKLVVDEIKWIKKVYDPDQLWFTDDVFTISKEWMKKFSEELFNRNLTISYECISRTDCMDDDIINLLRKTGCRKIWIGAESGSQKVLDLMNRKTNIFQTIGIFSKLHENSIPAGTFLMLGYPGETIKDILLTSQFLKKARPDEFTLTMAYPIKGTRFYSDTENRFITPFEWETMTDRDIKFKKPYNRRFYRFAMRYLYNTYKAGEGNKGIKQFPYFVKSMVSRLFMFISQYV